MSERVIIFRLFIETCLNISNSRHRKWFSCALLIKYMIAYYYLFLQNAPSQLIPWPSRWPSLVPSLPLALPCCWFGNCSPPFMIGVSSPSLRRSDRMPSGTRWVSCFLRFLQALSLEACICLHTIVCLKLCQGAQKIYKKCKKFAHLADVLILLSGCSLLIDIVVESGTNDLSTTVIRKRTSYLIASLQCVDLLL